MEACTVSIAEIVLNSARYCETSWLWELCISTLQAAIIWRGNYVLNRVIEGKIDESNAEQHD